MSPSAAFPADRPQHFPCTFLLRLPPPIPQLPSSLPLLSVATALSFLLHPPRSTYREVTFESTQTSPPRPTHTTHPSPLFLPPTPPLTHTPFSSPLSPLSAPGRRYGKYKPLTEPAKCQACGKRNVKDAYHAICRACAQEKGLCAKCRQPTKEIVQDGAAVRENEMKQLEEALGRLRERERRSLLRAVRACLSPLLRAVRACLSPLLRAMCHSALRAARPREAEGEGEAKLAACEPSP
ncbi:unnamed protein product [Closterium sp. NIES-65]|nr:unnamed protein product [Closterium sp. NIES-65]